jgi:hypothetical protein
MKTTKLSPSSTTQGLSNEVLDEIVGGGLLSFLGGGRGGSSGSGCAYRGGYQQSGYQQGSGASGATGGGASSLLAGLFGSLFAGRK